MLTRPARGRRLAAGASLLAAASALALAAPTPCAAQDGATSALDAARPASLNKFAFLKRLSLDLRGRPPAFEEVQALMEVDDVPGETIEAMLDSEGFLEVMVDYHRDLLWANVSDLQYIQFPWDLTRVTVGPPDDRHTVLHLRRKGTWFRGAPGTDESDLIPCSHLPAEFDEAGNPIVVEVDADGNRKEGWVWVEPYWDRDNPVKVCAHDAQEATVGAGGVRCNTPASRRETTCGCGPALAFCDYRDGEVNVQLDVGWSLNEQMLQIVRYVIANDLPYHEMLTTRISFVNGPLVHYYRHQMALASLVDLEPVPVEPIFLPDIPYDDFRFYEILQGPEHSGVLTAYAFLLRFQTNRGRVNRFYNAFLDSYFDASKSTGTDGCVDEGADLTKRCYCQNCHLALEPWAAHWARWKQQGGGYLSQGEFPIYDEVCEQCARTGVGSCPTYCRNEYVIETVPADREPYLGYLRGYEFLEPEHQLNTEAGPRLWVERTLQDGSLAHGVVSKLFKHLMRRPLADTKADRELEAQLVAAFIASNYDVKALVKAIVTAPAYRRIK